MSDDPSTSAQAAAARYKRAAHAMQSGIALDEQQGARNLAPKHLRVGVNSALVDSAGLATLLIKKGLITEDEYLEAIADSMEREQAAYEQRHGVELA